MAFRSVAIIGSGQMGSGIAQVCASKGIDTVLIKATPGDHAAAKNAIAKGLDKLVAKEKMTAADRDAVLARIKTSAALEDAKDCDLVVESIVEELQKKGELFAKLDKICKPETVLATNTSTLCVTELAGFVARKDKLVGLHFFNPAVLMKLVEIIPTIHSQAALIDELKAFCTGLGKAPVIVGDKTGFIVNRLLTPYMVDAIRVFQEGLASMQDIDAAMKNGCGHPMGPIELADYIGLDIVDHMATNLYEDYKEPRLAPPPILRRLVMAGQLGRKSGKGFYDYSAGQHPRNELAGR